MNLYGSLQSFFDTGFYYPNSAFLGAALIGVFTIGIIWIIGFVWLKFLRKHVEHVISEKADFIFVILLFLMIFTRFSTTYLNTQEKQILPDSQFAMDRVGRDWLDGVMQPAFSLLDKQPFNPAIGYGQSLTTVVGLIVSPLRSLGICTLSHAIECSNSVYKVVFVLIFVGFFLVVSLFPYGKEKIVVLLIIMTFYLGYSGSLGLDRGNLDIVFSFLIFLFAMFRLRKNSQTMTQVISETILLAFMTNTKITMLPFAVAFLLTSDYPGISVSVFAGSFLGFSYVPLLLHRSASFLDPIVAAAAFQKRFSDLFSLWCQPGNHVLYSVASYAINCSKQAISEHMRDYWIIVHGIAYFFFGLIILWPLRSVLHYVLNHKIVERVKLIHRHSRQGLLLLMLCFATAAINLLPFLSYGYRLYFSFACILAVWYSAKDSVARRAIILSSLLLLIKGLWIQDSRILNIVIALHYYYLISATAAIIMNQMGNRISQRTN